MNVDRQQTFEFLALWIMSCEEGIESQFALYRDEFNVNSRSKTICQLIILAH